MLLKFPEPSKVEEYLEPYVLGTMILPEDYLGKVMTLCQVYTIINVSLQLLLILVSIISKASLTS